MSPCKKKTEIGKYNVHQTCNGDNPILNTNIADDLMRLNRTSLQQSLDRGDHFDDVLHRACYNHQHILFFVLH